MTSRHRRSAVAALAIALLALSGCHREKQSGPLYILLTFNGGACEQNGSTGVIDVFQNQAVIYEGAASLAEFEVQFPACPFGSCPVSSPHGTSVNIGQPSAGTVGTTFKYSGMTINDERCENASQMGVRVRSGP